MSGAGFARLEACLAELASPAFAAPFLDLCLATARVVCSALASPGPRLVVNAIGSCAAGVAVPGVSDLDLGVSLPADAPRPPGWLTRTLERVVRALEEHLPGSGARLSDGKGRTPVVKLAVGGLRVDVVLGAEDRFLAATGWAREQVARRRFLRPLARGLKTLLFHGGLLSSQVRGGVPSYVLFNLVVATLRRLADDHGLRDDAPLGVALLGVVHLLAHRTPPDAVLSAADEYPPLAGRADDAAAAGDGPTVRDPQDPARDCAQHVRCWPQFVDAMRHFEQLLILDGAAALTHT